MFRRTLPVVATVAWMLAANPAGAVAPMQKRASAAPVLEPTVEFERPANELLREAKDLWLMKEDFTGALAKFNAAVAADPGDNEVRLQRAHFFEVLAQIVVPDDRTKFEERARTDFEQIVSTEPESLIAGVARDGLSRLAGPPLIESKPVTCPASAANAHARANALYGAHKFKDAVVEYGRAAEGCPEAASWWVDLADTFYEVEDYPKAKKHFLKALSVDPWNREAHRFLADVHVQLGDNAAAVHQLVLAVVSDPTYEAGWSALRGYASALGFSWKRVYGDRRPVAANADGTAWTAYLAMKAAAREAPAGSASALAVERKAVKAALEAAPPGPFWSMLSRAEGAGYLDEAIFLHLLDPALAAEYPAFREEHAEELAAYLETVILR